MCKFKKIKYSHYGYLSSNLHYIPQIKACYEKYLKFLQDDFLLSYHNDILSLIQSIPHFWVITDYCDEFMGFVYLDNFTGSKNFLYSAELTTCFDRKAWGNFTRYSAKFFLKKAFDEFGLQKIKAQIYPDNFRIKKLLKSSGFIYESTLKNETIRQGKMQDLEVYSIYRDYYYKTR